VFEVALQIHVNSTICTSYTYMYQLKLAVAKGRYFVSRASRSKILLKLNFRPSHYRAENSKTAAQQLFWAATNPRSARRNESQSFLI
jgi:hypothetical protein